MENCRIKAENYAGQDEIRNTFKIIYKRGITFRSAR